MMINLTLGSFYSIGNVAPYIISYMKNNNNPNVKNEETTWITASYLLGQGIFIIVGSNLETLFNTRVAAIVGCVVHFASTFATMWALDLSLPTVALTYGFGSGAGCGAAYIASIIAAQRWFAHSKGFATGLVVSSFGLGGLLFSPLQTLYMNPNNIPTGPNQEFVKSVYEKTPSLFMYMALLFACIQIVGCCLAFPGPPLANAPQNPERTTTPPAVRVADDDLLPQLSNFTSSFKYRIFYVIGAMMMLVAPGVTFVNSLGKIYGLTHIKDDRFLATIIAIAAIPNAFGRISWGLLIEKFGFRLTYTIKVVLFATLVILFPYDFILSSKVLYSIWMIGLFFGFSGTFVLFPVYIEQVFGPKYHGMVYGFLYIFLAISSIITAIIIQLTIGPKLKSNEEGLYIRIVTCTTIALLYLITLALYYFLLPVRRLNKAIQRKAEQDVEKTKNTLFNRQDLYPLDRKAVKSDIFQKDNSLGSIVRFRDSPRTS